MSTRLPHSPHAGGAWSGHLPLACCWGCELRFADTPLSWTGRCQPSAPRWSLRKAGCTTSPDIRSPSAHTPAGGGGVFWLTRAHIQPSQKQRPTHLSVLICALRHVQNPVHLHVIRVKRLVIHLENTQRHSEVSTHACTHTHMHTPLTSVMKLLSCCLALNLLTFWWILLSFSSSSRSAQRQWRYELKHKNKQSIVGNTNENSG